LGVEPLDEDVDCEKLVKLEQFYFRQLVRTKMGALDMVLTQHAVTELTRNMIDILKPNDTFLGLLPGTLQRFAEVLGVVHEQRFVDMVLLLPRSNFDDDDSLTKDGAV
jgi:hypothetical protein